VIPLEPEKVLKDLILSRYKSIREFAIETGIPYSTIDSIFKRGIANSGVSNVMKICNKLGIDIDSLIDGRVSYKISDNSVGNDIGEYINALHQRPELRILFSKTSKATKEDIEQTVKIIEALKKGND
jgi:transcriptional regulator with XRE-family HTH domain